MAEVKWEVITPRTSEFRTSELFESLKKAKDYLRQYPTGEIRRNGKLEFALVNGRIYAC